MAHFSRSFHITCVVLSYGTVKAAWFAWFEGVLGAQSECLVWLICRLAPHHASNLHLTTIATSASLAITATKSPLRLLRVGLALPCLA